MCTDHNLIWRTQYLRESRKTSFMKARMSSLSNNKTRPRSTLFANYLVTLFIKDSPYMHLSMWGVSWRIRCLNGGVPKEFASYCRDKTMWGQRIVDMGSAVPRTPLASDPIHGCDRTSPMWMLTKDWPTCAKSRNCTSSSEMFTGHWPTETYRDWLTSPPTPPPTLCRNTLWGSESLRLWHSIRVYTVHVTTAFLSVCLCVFLHSLIANSQVSRPKPSTSQQKTQTYKNNSNQFVL